MAMGFEDEFDYLDDDSLESDVDFAPAIKGSRDASLVPEAEEEVVEEEKPEEVVPAEESKYDSIIFVVKVGTNAEDKAFEMITDKVTKKSIGIYAVTRPYGLRGYIFLEAPDREHAEEAVYNLPYVKGILPHQITYAEIRQMIEPKASEIKIEKNDVVEIIGEAFKNEKAKVVRVDKDANEAVVSLLGAAVPIPVTVKLDNLRVIRREEMEE
jgi:transcriptional antiterminator NusG